MLAGEPYLAMTDADLTNGRLRTRPLLQAFNNAPWPRVPEDPQSFPTDFYGPERRSVALKVERRCRGLTDYSACIRSVPPIPRIMHSRRHESFSPRGAMLEELFGLAPGDVARLGIEIEPQFACDYGVNITFTGHAGLEHPLCA